MKEKSKCCKYCRDNKDGKIFKCWNPNCLCHDVTCPMPKEGKCEHGMPIMICSGCKFPKTESVEGWEERFLYGMIKDDFVVWKEVDAPTKWHIDYETIKSFLTQEILKAKEEERGRVLKYLQECKDKGFELETAIYHIKADAF